MNARAFILYTLLALAIGACARNVADPQATLPAKVDGGPLPAGLKDL